MKLKQEIEKGSNYEEGFQGKRVRYNALTEEMLMNILNNKQVSTVRAPPNYSQVLQAPAPIYIQMGVDREGNGMGQFPFLPKPQLPRPTTVSMVTIPHEANWMPTKEIRPTVGLQGRARGNMMPWASTLNIGTKPKVNLTSILPWPTFWEVGQHTQTCMPMCKKHTYWPKRHGVQCRTLHWSNGRHPIGCQQR